MKLFSFLCIIIGVSISSVTAIAQAPASKKVPYPGDPAIALRAPEKARWVVTYNPSKAPEGTPDTTGDGGEKKPPFSQRVTFVKDGGIVFERIVKAKGAARDKWSIQGYTFSAVPGQARHTAMENGSRGDDYYSDFSKSDFSGFEWVTSKTYVDVKKVLGRDCLMYRQEAGEGQEEAVAYVEYRTRLPVLLQKKGETRVYHFEGTPTTPLALPADAKAFLDARAKLAQDAARAAANHGR